MFYRLPALLCLFACSLQVDAGELIFDNGDVTGNTWESPGNWAPDQTPGTNDDAFIGGNFTAVLSQTGQAVNVLYIGHDNLPSPGPGTLVLSSGSFSSTTARIGGATNITRNPGTYNISGGTWNIGLGGATVGHRGGGTFNMSGGRVQAAAGIVIGNNGSTGVVGVSQGIANIDAGGMEVGKGAGAGTFNISGGTWNVADGVQVGASFGGRGTLNISGGTFNVPNGGVQMGIGGGGGTWNMSGGTLMVADGVLVGASAGGLGTLNISGGTFNIRNGGLQVASAAGAAGVVDISNAIWVVDMDGVGVASANASTGTIRAGTGTYNISGGGVQVGKGSGGHGTFNISGGTWNIADGIQVGVTNAGEGTLNISAGTLTIPNGGVQVGRKGSQGTFNLTGGTVRLSEGGMQTGKGSGGRGTFQLSGGTMAVTTNDVEIATLTGGSGAMLLDGGVFVLQHGNLIDGIPGASNAVVRLQGSTLDLNGGNIVLAGNSLPSNEFAFASGILGNIDSFTGDLHQQGGRLDLGVGPSYMSILAGAGMNGDYRLYSPATLRIKIAGIAGPGLPGGHDCLLVAGDINLNADGLGGGILNIAVNPGLNAGEINSVFVIMENEGSGTTTGKFSNATSGQITGPNGELFAISYTYDAEGDQASNDVALTLLGSSATLPPTSIPDSWKADHWGSLYLYSGDSSDDDGDTQLNVEEYIAGMNPLDSNSVFRVAAYSVNATAAAINVQTVTGRLYHLDYRGNMGNATGWMPVSSNTVGTGGLIAMPDTSTPFRTFHRVRVNLAP